MGLKKIPHFMREEEHSLEVCIKNKHVPAFQEKRGGSMSSPGKMVPFAGFVWDVGLSFLPTFSLEYFFGKSERNNANIFTS